MDSGLHSRTHNPLVGGSNPPGATNNLGVASQTNYGVNPAFQNQLASGRLKFVAFSADGAARALELTGHPFFFATLFQPERSAAGGTAPSPCGRRPRCSGGRPSSNQMTDARLAWRSRNALSAASKAFFDVMGHEGTEGIGFPADVTGRRDAGFTDSEVQLAIQLQEQPPAKARPQASRG